VIDAALVGGTPRRELARHYGLSATAVRRHAGAHLAERLAFDLDPEPHKGVLATETWMIVGEAENARRMLDRVRATGLPDSAMRELARMLDSVVVARGGR